MRTFVIARRVVKQIAKLRDRELSDAVCFFSANVHTEGEMVVTIEQTRGRRRVVVTSDGSTIFDSLSFRVWLRLRLLLKKGYGAPVFKTGFLPSSGYSEIINV